MWLNVWKFRTLGILVSLRKELVGLINVPRFHGLWSERDGVLLELSVNVESKIRASFKNIHCALK